MLRKIAGIIVAVVAVLGGSLILMGHLRSQEADFASAELTRLKNLSRSWEGRLLGVRATFHDQMWRHRLGSMLDHPDEWSSTRVSEKIAGINRTWVREQGIPRGFGFLDGYGELHTVVGDTTGLREAAGLFVKHGNPDMVLGEQGANRKGYIALQLQPPASEDVPRPGRLIALVDAASVLKSEDELPKFWMLMDGPKNPLFSSESFPMAPIQKATWNILMSEGSGVVPQQDGTPYGFCRVQIPGLNPLLLISRIQAPTSASETTSAMILVIGGLLLLLVLTWPRREYDPTVEHDHGEPDSSAGEPVTFRQLFHSMRQPTCVVDSGGKLIRVNKAGRTLLQLRKGGKPNPDLKVRDEDRERSIMQFLEDVAADTESVTGTLKFETPDESIFSCTVEATRLYTDPSGKGPVLMEFHPLDVAGEDDSVDPSRDYPEEVEASADDYNPDPVIMVGEDGIIREYNEASVEICPQIRETPLLADILPGIERRDLPDFLATTEDDQFESLFGSRTYRFRAARTPVGILLYGQPLVDTKELEIALDQAQENFNSLCSLTPAAVLLVDPWDYQVLDANTKAAEIFGVVHQELRGRNLNDFGNIPWDDSAESNEFELQTADGTTVFCRFEQDLIKLEGEPALLAVISPLSTLKMDHVRGLADEAQAMAGAVQEVISEPELPIGPGLLIVNNPSVREVARRMLDKTGHCCETFSTLDDATAWIFGHEVRPRFLAIDMNDFSEIDEWISMIRDRCGEVPCLALISGKDGDLPDDGPNQYLEKPFELETLNHALAEMDLLESEEAVE